MRFAIPLLFALALPTVASAAPDTQVRGLRGEVVDLEHPGTVVAFWSVGCGRCVTDLRDLVATGVHVVTVNTDPVQLRGRLGAWMRARGLDLPVIADPTGELRALFDDAPHGTVSTRDEGLVTWHSTESASRTTSSWASIEDANAESTLVEPVFAR